jgi:putative restriction endonuclease
MFDEGLWSLDNDYRVLVNVKRFDESGADAFLLSLKANTRILLPADPTYWPDQAHLAWHRKHHGFEPV